MNGSNLPLPAMRLGEIVLATGNYEVMKAWYRVMLDLEPSLEHAPTDESATRSGSSPPKPTRMCFFRLHAEHPYQDVIALFEMPGAECCHRTLGPAPYAASQRLDARVAGAISALASSRRCAVSSNGSWPEHEPVLPRSRPERSRDIRQQLRDQRGSGDLPCFGKLQAQSGRQGHRSRGMGWTAAALGQHTLKHFDTRHGPTGAIRRRKINSVGSCHRTLGPAPHAASQRFDERVAGAISALASSRRFAVSSNGSWLEHEPVLPRSRPECSRDFRQQLLDQRRSGDLPCFGKLQAQSGRQGHRSRGMGWTAAALGQHTLKHFRHSARSDGGYP